MTGLTVLLTRPDAQSRRFAARVLDRIGTEPRIVIAPLMRIDPVAPLPELLPGDVPVFTSENGVESYARLGGRGGGTAWCVGPRTAAAARRLGFDVAEGPGDLAGLAVAIAAEGAGAGRIVHLHGTHVAGDLAGMLRAAGRPADEAAIYDQRALPLSREARMVLAGTDRVLVPLFSARSARLLAPGLNRAQADLRIAAISPAVAGALPLQSGAKIAVAARPDAEAVLDVLAELAENAGFLEGRHGAG